MSKHCPSLINRRRVLRYAVGATLGGGLSATSVGRALAVGQSSVDPLAAAIDTELDDGWQEIALSSDASDDQTGDSFDEIAEVELHGDAEIAEVGPLQDDSSPADPGRLQLPPERRLRLVNDHTGEKLDIAYVTRGLYIDESLESIAHLMRDHRADKEREMDTRLLDILFQVQQQLAVDQPVHVLSGYRTPETNAALRKRSSGVARYSLHMEGKAADFHVPGVKTSDLRTAALSLRAGGVGYYSRSNFVHVDTGIVRSWRG